VTLYSLDTDSAVNETTEKTLSSSAYIAVMISKQWIGEDVEGNSHGPT
jgi:hypothetical protein